MRLNTICEQTQSLVLARGEMDSGKVVLIILKLTQHVYLFSFQHICFENDKPRGELAPKKNVLVIMTALPLGVGNSPDPSGGFPDDTLNMERVPQGLALRMSCWTCMSLS